MIRVFVGCAPNHEDAESQAVFEWSLRKHASEPVEIEWMRLSKDPRSFWFSDGDALGWRTDRWATPFSGFRWAVPAFCNFEGRAIYADSDVIWMADVAELWHQKMAPGTVALAKARGSWRFCVSLWNCAEAGRHLRPLEALRSNPDSHAASNAYFGQYVGLVRAFEGDWNCLDGEGHADLKDGALKALHYTDMSCQPQLRHALPRLAAAGQKHWFNGQTRRHPRRDVEALFDEVLEEAKGHGYGIERYLQAEPFGPILKKDLAGYRGRRVA
jgi:hypothetical protein